VHYRDWYTLLCAAGFRARGQDPLANFLAQISRSTDVSPWDSAQVATGSERLNCFDRTTTRVAAIRRLRERDGGRQP
jgi:hypothetical protein